METITIKKVLAEKRYSKAKRKEYYLYAILSSEENEYCSFDKRLMDMKGLTIDAEIDEESRFENPFIKSWTPHGEEPVVEAVRAVQRSDAALVVNNLAVKVDTVLEEVRQIKKLVELKIPPWHRDETEKRHGLAPKSEQDPPDRDPEFERINADLQRFSNDEKERAKE